MLPGKLVQAMRLDGRDQFLGFSSRRNVIVPAAGAHLLKVQTEHAIGQIVPVPEVAQKPAVDSLGTERVLYCLDVHEWGSFK